MKARQLSAVLIEHGRWADARQCGGTVANLRYADLRYADLRNANLRNANLRYADLRYADLRNANLRNADLSNAGLRYADLRNAGLRYADLSNADLSDANLRYADLRYADLRYADLSNADLVGTCLDPASVPRKGPPVAPNTHRKLVKGRARIYGWRTRKSAHVGSIEYLPNRWRKANALSTCPYTECHPGIYLGGEPHGSEQVLVWAYEEEAHYVSQDKGYRARRVYVTGQTRTLT